MCDITTNVSHWHIQIFVRVFCKLISLLFSIPLHLLAFRSTTETPRFAMIPSTRYVTKKERECMCCTTANWNVVCLWFSWHQTEYRERPRCFTKLQLKRIKINGNVRQRTYNFSASHNLYATRYMRAALFKIVFSLKIYSVQTNVVYVRIICMYCMCVVCDM